MFGKLLAIVLAVFATAATLLVIRQQRLEIAHDISEGHRRLQRYEQTLWKLQAEIAARCGPDQVQEVLDDLGGEWKPIPPVPGIAPVPDPGAPADTPETMAHREPAPELSG